MKHTSPVAPASGVPGELAVQELQGEDGWGHEDAGADNHEDKDDVPIAHLDSSLLDRGQMWQQLNNRR